MLLLLATCEANFVENNLYLSNLQRGHFADTFHCYYISFLQSHSKILASQNKEAFQGLRNRFERVRFVCMLAKPSAEKQDFSHA